jgi:glycosyltransferase involved in cell wall biosynthesis
MLNRSSVSVIVPALNEQVLIGEVVREILEQVEARFSDYEIILVDDGSTDDTGRIMDGIAAANARVRVIHNRPNLGFGRSFREGCKVATKEYIMLLCGDGGLPASSLPAIIDKIGTADIVIPYMTNLREIKTPFRYFLSRLYTFILNRLAGLNLNYFNGLPVNRRALLEGIELTSGGFGFQAEMLVKLIKSGHTYVEVGVLGAEKANRSVALRFTNWVSVGRTVLHLFSQIRKAAVSGKPKSGPG